MENVKFIDYTMMRLDVLKKETGKSSYSNAKSNFKKALAANIPAEPSLSAVFTNKQGFNKYGKLFFEFLKEQQRITAQRENREFDSKKASSRASVAKGALKPIFEIIGKEVKAILVGQDRAKNRTKKETEDLNFEGKSFTEAFNAVCYMIFPEVTGVYNMATLLAKETDNQLTASRCAKWLIGTRHPDNSIENIKGMEKLELLAGVPSGTLTKFMPSGVGCINMADRVSYKIQVDQIKSKYSLSSKAQAQFDRLTMHMMGKGSTRKLKPVFHNLLHHSDLLNPSQLWTLNGENECSTSETHIGTIKIYRQWLMDHGYISDPKSFVDPLDFKCFFESWISKNERYIRSRKAQLGVKGFGKLQGDDFKENIMKDKAFEDKAFIAFVEEEKGFDYFTGLDEFIDFDMSYLLVEEYIEAFINSRLNAGVTTSVGSFIEFIGTGLSTTNTDVCYLSLFHAPEELMGYSIDEEGYNAWKKDEKSLIKYLKKESSALENMKLDEKKEAGITVGKRNIAHLIREEFREECGLDGGVKEGAIEYSKIITQLEKDGESFGNNYHGSIGYNATQSALFMRLMFQQPMRLGNWKDLRLMTHADALKSRVPCIYKHKGRYHLRVQPRFVKNNRYLKTDFTLAMTKHIDNYLVKRASRLEDRGATSDFFLIGYRGGRFEGNILSKYTYAAMKVLWPEREFITWGFNPHSLRHFVATLYLADNPNDIYRCAELIQDKPETVIKNYIEKDKAGIAEHHSSWSSIYD